MTPAGTARQSGCRWFNKAIVTLATRPPQKSFFARRRNSPLWRFLIGDERGSAMVEFAIVAALIFIPLVFGIIEFGRLIWSKTTITAAARRGGRLARVRGSADPETAQQ